MAMAIRGVVYVGGKDGVLALSPIPGGKPVIFNGIDGWVTGVRADPSDRQLTAALSTGGIVRWQMGDPSHPVSHNVFSIDAERQALYLVHGDSGVAPSTVLTYRQDGLLFKLHTTTKTLLPMITLAAPVEGCAFLGRIVEQENPLFITGGMNPTITDVLQRYQPLVLAAEQSIQRFVIKGGN